MGVDRDQPNTSAAIPRARDYRRPATRVSHLANPRQPADKPASERRRRSNRWSEHEVIDRAAAWLTAHPDRDIHEFWRYLDHLEPPGRGDL